MSIDMGKEIKKARKRKMKTENWNGNEIRFVMHQGEWWAIAKDICIALGLDNATKTVKRLEDEEKALLLFRA